MKKYMLGLAALLLMVTMGSAALAGAGDQVDRLCPTCGVTTTGTVVDVMSWTSSQHQFTFKCGTCQSTSQFDEAHCGDSLATCTTAGTCTICGQSYTDPTNHPDVKTTVGDVEPNDHYVTRVCTACQKTIFQGYEHHVRKDGLFMYIDRGADYHDKYYRCTICNNPMSYILPSEPHTYSEATCVDVPTCVCGRVGGGIDPDNHDWSDWTWLDSNQHIRTCLREGCSQEDIAYHTGGTATATEQAVCEECHSPYGGLLPVITSPAQDKTVTVYVGERARMDIVAVNAAHYQWMMSTDGGAVWTPCGEDSPVYTTAPAQMKNNGYLYKCIATGSETIEEEIPSGPVEMSLRSTDDALPDNPLMAESPVFTLEVISRSAIPQTGDGSHPELWLALGLVSIAALAGIALHHRKHRTK